MPQVLTVAQALAVQFRPAVTAWHQSAKPVLAAAVNPLHCLVPGHPSQQMSKSAELQQEGVTKQQDVLCMLQLEADPCMQCVQLAVNSV